MFIVFVTFLIVKLLNCIWPTDKHDRWNTLFTLFRHQCLFFSCKPFKWSKGPGNIWSCLWRKAGKRERQKEVSSSDIPLRSSVTQQCLLGDNVMCVHHIKGKRYGVGREEREKGHNQFTDPISIMSSPVSIDLRRKLLTMETKQSCTLINVLVQILICSTRSLKKSLNTNALTWLNHWEAPNQITPTPRSDSLFFSYLFDFPLISNITDSATLAKNK